MEMNAEVARGGGGWRWMRQEGDGEGGNFYTNFQVDKIGRMVSVGDGIARAYGLNEIQAGEMVESASSVKGIVLNLENENVCIVVFGGDTTIKEEDLIKRTESIVDVRGTVSGITIIRPIALILPKLQMAQLSQYVPLIDGSIEQPA